MRALLTEVHSRCSDGEISLMSYNFNIYRLKNLLLARGMEVIDTALGGEEALKKAMCLKPDVVLMDIMMKPVSGLQATRIIKAQCPGVNIIMLTASESEDDVFEAIKSGASGYLLKSLDADVLFEMLMQAESGGFPVSPLLASKLLKEYKISDDRQLAEPACPNESEGGIGALSGRQREVLIMVAKGMRYKEIAAELGVTERTVKYYIEMILRKLHMQNRSEAVRFAIQEGIVE